MPRISDAFIEEVKESVDIVEIVSEYVQLKKTGKNYKGLCPFHQEKTPSFTVNPEEQFYYCFGCGAGGNAFNFLMEIENITFIESLKILAKRAGVSLPDTSPYEKQLHEERERLFAINKLAAKFYHYLLLKKNVGKKAVTYLEGRGYTREDIKRFYLGYAPDSWRALYNFLTSRGYEATELLKAGLVLNGSNNSYYDRFRGRIIFPIFNLRGEVLAFGGRIIDDTASQPKYLNSPDTPIYQKGDNLYGLNWARQTIRKKDKAIIMEGYTDVLRAQKAGIKNVVASLGTALTENQARLLKRYADTVFISYDADTAGAQATLRGLDILRGSDLQVKVIPLPKGQDPDEFIDSKGKESFIKLQEKALSLFDFKIQQIATQLSLELAEDKIKFNRKVVSLLAEIDDKIEREVYLEKVTDDYNLDKELIREEITKRIRQISKKKDKNYKNRYTKKDNETNYRDNINKLEGLILKSLIDYPKYRKNIIKSLQPDFFSGLNKKVAQLLWKEKDLSYEEIEDEKVQKKYMALKAVEKIDLTGEKLNLMIQKLLHYRKFDLYQKLQKRENLSLKKLNQLLTTFKSLSDYHRKEGV